MKIFEKLKKQPWGIPGFIIAIFLGLLLSPLLLIFGIYILWDNWRHKKKQNIPSTNVINEIGVKAVGTAEVNKALKKHLFPEIRQLGFTKFKGKKCYKYNESSVFVVSVEAVGKHFSDVTGFTPSSFMCTLGVYFPFVINKYDPEGEGIEYDKDGLPVGISLHQLLRLENFDFSKQKCRRSIENPANTTRKDVWWVEHDGSNAEDMVLDLVAAFQATAPEWFVTYEDLETAFHEIEKERDCPGKFEKLYYMAKELKNEAMAEHYKAKMP